ncbi:hypothetical protein DFH09DRAFT_335029 [Mycena vulgaris]|nr:hypothetical protein DFH09DRAFT_335029 [Mycena vulgaris]
MQPYTTPREVDLSDAESAPARSSSPPSKTKKQLREMRLRADPLVDVQGPTLVHCLNCGAPIKLSHKSEYDASHWLRHRARCVKKSKAREAERGIQPASISRAPSTTGSSPASSARALTPHDGDEDIGSSLPGITTADPLALSTDLPVSYDWQSWDWSQLKSRFTDAQLL